VIRNSKKNFFGTSEGRRQLGTSEIFQENIIMELKKENYDGVR
jgi:hypothetical protein